ncbi:MAG: hypothetical protein KKA42_06120 [candidate division Zixibacteria bacterium]|nr:hypothetical protein [candidate division Zixibacteria bacterium]
MAYARRDGYTFGGMLENALNILLLVLLLGLVAFWVTMVTRRHRRLIKILHAIIESQDQALLFYDERGRIVYHSAGLVVFDRRSLNKLSRLERPPMLGQDLKGELEIDSNVYRYTSKLLEYKPNCPGVLILLDYVGPNSARQ